VRNNPLTESKKDPLDPNLTRASRIINTYAVNKIACIVMAGGLHRDLVDGEDLFGLLAVELDQYLDGKVH